MKFINYVNIKTGKLNANASDENGIYPFYTCADVPLKINMALDNCECLLLVGNGANTGKVFYNNGPFNAYQRTYIIKSTQIFNHKYLFWFLKSKTKFLLASSIGSATNYIKLGDIENLNISEKTEEEQDNIVFELNSYQKLLELKNNELLMLDNLIKSRFISLEVA